MCYRGEVICGRREFGLMVRKKKRCYMGGVWWRRGEIVLKRWGRLRCEERERGRDCALIWVGMGELGLNDGQGGAFLRADGKIGEIVR